MMDIKETVTLNNGTHIPRVGFGVYQIPGSQTTDMVRLALDAGYRLIDTAQVYGNEAEVGQAVLDSGLPREDIFITTKLSPMEHGFASTVTALEDSLRRLRTPYVDLFLIHWPSPSAEQYLETWRTLEKLRDAGKLRSIGVSNVNAAQLEWLTEKSGTIPAVNQVEIHPHYQQADLRDYHHAQGIISEAWGPIGRGKCLSDPTLVALSEKYGKTTAQLILRWHLQIGNVTLIKTATPSRVRENLEIFDFQLDARDMDKISSLDGNPGGAPSLTEASGRPRWTP